MLDTSATVVVAELLDLTLLHTIGRLVDRHFDLLIKVDHDNRSQRRVVRVDHLVIDRPETVEVKHLLVPLGDRLHLAILLVADAVIDVQELGDGHETVKGLGQVMSLVAGQEGASVVHALHEGMDGVAIRLDACNDNAAVLIRERLGLADASGAPRRCLVVDTSSVVDVEGDVLHTITVLSVVSRELFMVRVQRRREHERDLVVLHDVGAKFSLASLKALQTRSN